MIADLLDLDQKITTQPMSVPLSSFSKTELRRIIALLAVVRTNPSGDTRELIQRAKKIESYLDGPITEGGGY